MCQFLLLSEGCSFLLRRSQSTSNGASLLGSEVKRLVFLSSVESVESIFLCLIDNGQNSGDRLTNDLYFGEF